MSKPENTSKRDPMLHLAAVWPRPGQDTNEVIGDYITGMEAAGQRQLVASEHLPTEAHPDDAAFIALGFTFGDPDPADPLFRPATLPAGWSKRATDHAMGSIVVDERGIERVSIFYKAAFYDRRANMMLTRVGWKIANHEICGDGPVQCPWELLTDAERAEVRETAEDYLAKAAEYPTIYEHADRARALLDQP